MKKIAITKEGEKTNKLFCHITDFSKMNDSDPQGDAAAIVDGNFILVEIKKDTYNQVRPYKYNVLVGYQTNDEQWYVIPPDVVISEMAFCKRGQHTTDPIEVCNLGKVNSKKFEKFKVQVDDLKEAVCSAYIQGQKNHLIRNYAEQRKKEYEQTPEIRKKEVALLKEMINAQLVK